MKAMPAALVVVGFVALAAASGIAAAASVHPNYSDPGIASAVSFNLNYSDPASDVVKLWTSNMTPVPTSTGDLTMSPFPDSVNLRWIRSANASANVNLTLEVQGDIANLDNTSYEIRLYTRADNASHFIVTYVNGATWLTSNATGFVPVDISGNSTISSTGPNPALQNALHIRVAKSLLGTITVWNMDATATQRGSTYTYRDFGWEVPGNPGSSPTPPPTPSALPSWAWIALALAIVAVLVAIVVAIRRKRTPPQK